VDAIDEILSKVKPAAAPSGDSIDAILAKARPKEPFDAIVARTPGPAEAPQGRQYTSAPIDALHEQIAALQADEQRRATDPSLAGRFKRGFGNAAATFAGGAHAVAETAAHPIDTITSGPRRRQFVRGVDDMLTLGHGQRLAARVGNALGDTPDVAIGPETFGGGIAGSGGMPVPNTQAGDQAVAPEFRQLGNVAGVVGPGLGRAAAGTLAEALGRRALATGAAPGVVGNLAARASTAPLGGLGEVLANAGQQAAGRLIPGLGAAPGAVRGMLGYQLSAPAAAGLSADAEGDRVGAALDAATDPFGNLVAGGLGAAIGGAPDRVANRIVKDVPHGEATAKLSTAKKFEARIGPDGEFLQNMLDRDPKLERQLAISAKSNPKKVAETAQGRIERYDAANDRLYDKIDNAPDRRFVSGPDVGRPIGGIDVHAIDQALAKLEATAKDKMQLGQTGPVAKVRAALAEAYGEVMEDGSKKVVPGTVKPSRDVRSFASNDIGKVAFAGDPNIDPPERIRAQQRMYRAVTDVIEDAAKGRLSPGEVAKLKTANRDLSILVPMRDALKERAAKEAVGRTSLYSLLGGSGVGASVGAGVGMGVAGPPGAFVGAKVGAGVGAAGGAIAGRAARTLDYELMRTAREQGGTAAAAKLMQLSRQGATDDELRTALDRMGIKLAD